MNRFKKILSNSQSGQATIIIVILVLIVGVFIVFQTKTTPIPVEKNSCVNIDYSRQIRYHNNSYILIRNVSALSTEQFKWHITKLPDMTFNSQPVYRAATNQEACAHEVPAGTDPDTFQKYCRDIAVAHQSPNRPASETYRFDDRFEVEDMLFTDVGEIYNLKQDGYVFVDIYYKASKINNLPTFITDFCNEAQPTDPIVIFPSKDGKVYPPQTVNPSEIVKFKDPGTALVDQSYTLFAYERTDSPAGRNFHANSNSHFGTLNKDGRTYQVHSASFAGYIALIDEKDLSIEYLYSKIIPTPTPTPPPQARNTLQIDVVNPSILQPWGWWSPECKPAVYLYPEQQTEINVQVEPKGFLTYTDPLYMPGGWTVIANPDGQISTGSKMYDYLYYESKIKDSEIEKPTKGYVVAYDQLSKLYDTLLPKLGLSTKEIKDFHDYWDNKLPASPYYFVGVMTEDAIDRIEPLTVTPKPKTIIRVRLYFEALDTLKSVEAPSLSTKQRTGFTVSEWGGVVKLHPGTEFTCSQ